MKRKITGGLVIIAVVLVSSFLLRNGDSPFCVLSAGAQDNPCLAQEATISALQLELLSVRATQSAQEIGFQATISAMQGAQVEPEGSITTGDSESPQQGTLFSDSFENNRNGWNIFSSPQGRATLTDGVLTVSANKCEAMWVRPESLSVEGDYYVEVKVRPNLVPDITDRILVGFAQGADDSHHHSFLVSFRNPRRPSGAVTFRDSVLEDPYFETQYETPLLAIDSFATIGLEARGGIYTLFVNGTPYDSYPITPHGSALGVYVAAVGPGFCPSGDPQSAVFDDFVVRQAP